MVDYLSDWKRMAYYRNLHHERYKKFIFSRKHLLFCMECRGGGGWREIIEPELGGPWYDCGWCEGTGYMTPKGYLVTVQKGGKT